MYICICNALTDRRVKDAIAMANSQHPEDVYAACGCRTKCGKCVRVVKEMLANHCAGFEAVPQAAE